MKEFCLSDEIVNESNTNWINVRYVKEFIKRLKEEWEKEDNKSCYDKDKLSFNDLIDKLAGDKFMRGKLK